MIKSGIDCFEQIRRDGYLENSSLASVARDGLYSKVNTCPDGAMARARERVMHPDPVPSCYKLYLLMMPNQLARISVQYHVTQTDSNQTEKHVVYTKEERIKS